MRKGGFVYVDIRKPLYDNFVYIRYDKYIRQAIERGAMLKIRIPQGVGIADPQEWMKTGKRMEKVFKRPDEPMVLFGNRVIIIKPKTEEEELKELSEVGAFG
jgi:hypothetical protein